MGYNEWLLGHAKKHKAIVDKLLKQGYDKERIIDYFEFENMVQNEPDFCPLYAKNKKCHDIEELNCYLCACPNFRFSDTGIDKIESKTRYSFCSINSKDGRVGIYREKIHQDCSGCSVPHSKEYILKHFDTDWMEIMKDVNLETR